MSPIPTQKFLPRMLPTVPTALMPKATRPMTKIICKGAESGMRNCVRMLTAQMADRRRVRGKKLCTVLWSIPIGLGQTRAFECMSGAARVQTPPDRRSCSPKRQWQQSIRGRVQRSFDASRPIPSCKWCQSSEAKRGVRSHLEHGPSWLGNTDVSFEGEGNQRQEMSDVLCRTRDAASMKQTRWYSAVGQ